MRFRLFLLFLVGSVALLSNQVSLAAITVVSPANMGTWAFYSTDASGTINTGTASGQLVTGPGSPPLGAGSANLQTGPGAGDGSEQLRNSDWAGTKLADLTTLSYSTYATSIGGDQLPFVNLYINYSGGTTRDDRLWFEPVYSAAGAGNGNPFATQPAVAINTWQTWDMLHGMWYSDSGTPNAHQFPADANGPGDHAITLADFIAAHPDAIIINDPGQGGLGGIRIGSGFSSDADTYNTSVDNFTIGTVNNTVTYDFESTPALEPGAVPEPATLAIWGIGALGCALGTYRRRKRTV